LNPGLLETPFSCKVKEMVHGKQLSAKGRLILLETAVEFT